MKLINISDSVPAEIISVDSGDLLFGRDTENSIVIDETSVSRVHGNIFEVSGNWFYRDLNSTNGSAINGTKINPDQIRILRDQDVIHLATFPIRYVEVKSKATSPNTGSLLSFLDFGFQSEFNFNSSNSHFNVGGKGADFVLGNLEAGEVLLSFEFDAADLTLKLKKEKNTTKVLLNGFEIGSSMPYLLDKDEIDIGNNKIIVNFVMLKSPAVKGHIASPSWKEDQATATGSHKNRFVFTSTQEEPSVTDTLSMKKADLMLGVGEFGVSGKRSALQKEIEQMDPDEEKQYIKSGIIVLIISLAAIGILIKIFST